MSEINVHIGELKTGKKGDVLKAILGSCIGVGILWKSNNLYGLIHCLLPKPISEDTKSKDENPAKYVSEGLPLLIKQMQITDFDLPAVEVVLVGGGNMNSTNEKSKYLIGDLNAQEALQIINKYGLKLAYQETGGNQGYKINIDCSTGKYNINRIPRIQEI